MNFIEFIAFIFTMFAMVWIMMRQARSAKDIDSEDSDEVIVEGKEQLRQLMRTLNVNIEEIRPKSESPPSVKPQKKLREPPPLIQKVVRERNMHSEAYSLTKESSRLKKIVQGLPSRKQIIIIRDVLSPPKGLS